MSPPVLEKISDNTVRGVREITYRLKITAATPQSERLIKAIDSRIIGMLVEYLSIQLVARYDILTLLKERIDKALAPGLSYSEMTKQLREACQLLTKNIEEPSYQLLYQLENETLHELREHLADTISKVS